MSREDEILRVEARVESKLDSLAEEIGDCHEELTVKINRMDECLRGNGRPGLVTQMAIHSERLDRLESFATEVTNLKRWLILGVLSVVGSLAFETMRHFISQGN